MTDKELDDLIGKLNKIALHMTQEQWAYAPQVLRQAADRIAEQEAMIRVLFDTVELDNWYIQLLKAELDVAPQPSSALAIKETLDAAE